MIVFKFAIGFIVIIIGLRMVGAGIYTFFTGKVLVRKGVKTKWVSLPSEVDPLTILAKDGLMGILLIVLGVMLIV